MLYAIENVLGAASEMDPQARHKIRLSLSAGHTLLNAYNGTELYYLISPKTSLFLLGYIRLLEVLSIILIGFTCFYAWNFSFIIIFLHYYRLHYF